MIHLNGKIGDVQPWRDEERSWVHEEKIYEVRFQDPDLEPCFVKPENIRILFELPDE